MDPLTLMVADTDPIDVSPETLKDLGGKAVGLHELKKAGVPVPSWTTVRAAMFRRLRQTDACLKELLGTNASGPADKASRVREYLLRVPLDDDLYRALVDLWNRISDKETRPVAVRSSAADEDGKVLSFAGQMDSFLNVRDKENFLNAVRGCWASLYGERAVQYRMRHGIDPWRADMAVVVQRMVEPDVAGVVFTANPLTGNPGEMMVSAVWGLGEGLVSGTLDADTFTLDAAGGVLKSEIVSKKQLIALAPLGGTATVDADPAKRDTPCLAARQLKELHRLAGRVRDMKGVPMDIEFAVEKDRIYLLQARPITNLKQIPAKDNFKVWDNSNIVESYSGVTTPLTFSFIRRAYYAVYCQFCETIGVDRRTVFRNRHVFENMLGLIEGRVYYNLLNWYRLVSLMPGFKVNRRFMEQMMGLQVIGDTGVTPPSGFLERYFVQLPRLIRVGLQMIAAHRQLPKKIARFHADFRAVYERTTAMDLPSMTPAALLGVYRMLEDEVLWNWKAPITNDFEAMIFYGLLKTLTVKWHLDPKGVLHNDLLCGEGGIRSTQVTTQLFALARMIEQDGRLKEDFLNASPREALEKLRTDAPFARVREAFEQYLRDYGVRCINEMKLESVPIKEDPVFCVAMIQNYLRHSVPDPERQAAHEKTIRRKAEEVIRRKLRDKNVFWVVPALPVYNWILGNARRAIKNRENQRFCRTEAYHLVRTIFRTIGAEWRDQGLIGSADDIFYLEMGEVWSFIEGTSTCVDLKALIALRKKEFDGYRSRVPDDHIETTGEVYAGNAFAREEAAPEGDGTLKGLGCCAGVVEREVRVVLNPDSGLKLNGEIMVARQTDPGWVVLFPSVSGLIIEKGSMLSHSAIVAREMGIPAVVGVKNATKILADGDRVVLNGAEGTIKILNKAGGS